MRLWVAAFPFETEMFTLHVFATGEKKLAKGNKLMPPKIFSVTVKHWDLR